MHGLHGLHGKSGRPLLSCRRVGRFFPINRCQRCKPLHTSQSYKIHLTPVTLFLGGDRLHGHLCRHPHSMRASAVDANFNLTIVCPGPSSTPSFQLTLCLFLLSISSLDLCPPSIHLTHPFLNWRYPFFVLSFSRFAFSLSLHSFPAKHMTEIPTYIQTYIPTIKRGLECARVGPPVQYSRHSKCRRHSSDQINRHTSGFVVPYPWVLIYLTPPGKVSRSSPVISHSFTLLSLCRLLLLLCLSVVPRQPRTVLPSSLLAAPTKSRSPFPLPGLGQP